MHNTNTFTGNKKESIKNEVVIMTKEHVILNGKKKKWVCWAIKKHGDPIKAGHPASCMKDPRYKGLARVDILSGPTFDDDEIAVAGTSSQTT